MPDIPTKTEPTVHPIKEHTTSTSKKLPKSKFEPGDPAWIVVLGARNNDTNKQWSEADRKTLETALQQCGIQAWTYIRADGFWSGTEEESRALLICAPEKTLYAALKMAASNLHQDEVLVVKVGEAHRFDTTKLKAGIPPARARTTPHSKRDLPK